MLQVSQHSPNNTLMRFTVSELISDSSILSNKSHRMLYWSLVAHTVHAQMLNIFHLVEAVHFYALNYVFHINYCLRSCRILSFWTTHFKWSNCQLPPSSLDCYSCNIVSVFTSVPHWVLDCTHKSVFTDVTAWPSWTYFRFIVATVVTHLLPPVQWNRCCASFAH